MRIGFGQPLQGQLPILFVHLVQMAVQDAAAVTPERLGGHPLKSTHTGTTFPPSTKESNPSAPFSVKISFTSPPSSRTLRADGRACSRRLAISPPARSRSAQIQTREKTDRPLRYERH